MHQISTDSGFQVNSFMQLSGITPKYTVGSTGFDTGGLFVVLKPFNAQITLHGDFPDIIELHRTKGACLQTFLASDAKIVVDEHYTAHIPADGLHRAGFTTGCVGAVVTINRNKIGCVFYHTHQPGPNAQSVFLFTGDFTGMAPHAVFFKKHQRNFFHLFSPHHPQRYILPADTSDMVCIGLIVTEHIGTVEFYDPGTVFMPAESAG